jgi:hypothetical protein
MPSLQEFVLVLADDSSDLCEEMLIVPTHLCDPDRSEPELGGTAMSADMDVRRLNTVRRDDPAPEAALDEPRGHGHRLASTAYQPLPYRSG